MINMLFEWIGILFVTVVTWVHAIGELPLNPHATLINEVKAITHNESSRRVTVDLADNRKCPQPTFIIRLSGTSLSILDMVDGYHNHPNQAVFSYVPIRDNGTYFLEVLAMYCETVDPSNISHMCLVHPQDGKNVLTLPYSFEVKNVTLSGHIRPRWLLAHNATPALLPTRYQKPCVTGGFCNSEESEIAQHNLYTWTDRPAYEHLVPKAMLWGLAAVDKHTQLESISICMVGASHANNLFLHGNALKVKHINFVLVLSRYPQHFEVRMLENCTYAVIGYGQWPLSSWLSGEAYNGPKYEAEMRRVLEVVNRAKLKTQVFVRSMNLNALGYTHIKCPAIELRSPPLVMMYNNILSNLAATYNVPYIDMFHLQGPLWDIALDWSHPKGRVFTAEAEYIIHAVLYHSYRHDRSVMLDPNVSARPKVVESPHFIQFSDSNIVYMEQVGELRPLPDANTMYRLGQRPENTLNMDAKFRTRFKFGPVLATV